MDQTSSRVAQWLYGTLNAETQEEGSAIEGWEVEPDQGSNTRGIVMRVLSPPVPLHEIGGEVKMTRSIWVVFAYDQRSGADRYALQPKADAILASLRAAVGEVVDGWRIAGVSLIGDWDRPEIVNGVQHRGLGGQVKVIASRAP